MPVGYLEQLAMPLRRAGLIEGTRGAHGGYQLARPPASLTVGQVVRALEGDVAPVECLTVDYVTGTCVREPDCLSRPVWRRVKESIDQALDSLTLADLNAESQAAPRAPRDAQKPMIEPDDSLPVLAASCFVEAVN